MFTFATASSFSNRSEVLPPDRIAFHRDVDSLNEPIAKRR
jgi:hypothetical protein